MYSNKFYGYVINSALKKERTQNAEEPDYKKIGLCGILNYLNSENPKKKYYGLN